MNREELEIILEDNLESEFKIKTDLNGQLIIYTGLIEDEDGELILFSDDNSDDDDDDSETFYTPSDAFEDDDSNESEEELDFND